MNFLRSIIADARPPKPVMLPRDDALTAGQQVSHLFYGGDGAGKGPSMVDPAPASGLDGQSPVQENTGRAGGGDTAGIEVKNEERQRFGDRQGHPSKKISIRFAPDDASDPTSPRKGEGAAMADDGDAQQVVTLALPDGKRDPASHQDDASPERPVTHHEPGDEQSAPDATRLPAPVVDALSAARDNNNAVGLLKSKEGQAQPAVDESVRPIISSDKPAQEAENLSSTRDIDPLPEKPVSILSQADATPAAPWSSDISHGGVKLENAFKPEAITALSATRTNSHHAPASEDHPAQHTRRPSLEDPPRYQARVEERGASGSRAPVTHSSPAKLLHDAPQPSPQSNSPSKEQQASTSAPAPAYSPRASDMAKQQSAVPSKPMVHAKAQHSAPARPIQADLLSMYGDTLQSNQRRSPSTREAQTPKVQIGRIDVIIEAPAPSTVKTAPAQSSADLASRHYLRRL